MVRRALRVGPDDSRAMLCQQAAPIAVPGQEGETWHASLTEPADGAILALWPTNDLSLNSDYPAEVSY